MLTDKARHDQLVKLGEQMLALHKQSARTPQEKEMVQREIEATDARIDALVYELYGLTDHRGPQRDPPPVLKTKKPAGT